MKTIFALWFALCLSAGAALPGPAWLAATKSAAGGSYTSGTGNFDGATSMNAALSGVTTNKLGTVSFWAKMTAAGDGSLQDFFRTQTTRVLIRRNADGTIRIYGKNPSDTVIMDCQANCNLTSADGWVWIMIGWNTATGTCQCYTNGVDTTITGVPTDDWVQWDDSYIHVSKSGSEINGCLASVYINRAEYLDPSVAGNRSKFASSNKPIDLGATGSNPTGNQPGVYLNGDGATFNVNVGSIGNFTVYAGSVGTCTPP